MRNLDTLLQLLQSLGREQAPDDHGIERINVANTLVGTPDLLLARARIDLEHLVVRQMGAVALKEGWPLILVPRESPLSLVALEGLVKLKQAGATILPACPGFYNRPKGIDELIDQLTYRVLDHLGLPMPGAPSWKDTRGEE